MPNTSPRGQPIPNTVDAWRQYAYLLQDGIMRDRDIISALKQRVNLLEQKLEK